MTQDVPLRIVPGGRSWPAQLDQIDGAPDELWLRGRLSIAERLGGGAAVAAIVGSRSPTPYGEAQAFRFGRALAAAGVVVVSGLARGVDQAAHRGALEAGGDTVAVLGCGVDRPWPRSRETERIERTGLLVSEYPPGQGPRRHHFPMRNRILSGLSQCVLVVEAGEASGSLITARWAADQGRDVFAIPGRIDHPMARGCHRLIREGAFLTESPLEVLSELGLADPVEPRAPARRDRDSALLRALEGETLSADELAETLERSVSSILVELVELELEGRVANCPGGLYRRIP